MMIDEERIDIDDLAWTCFHAHVIDNKFYCDLWQYASVKFENKLLAYYNKFYCDLWRYVSVNSKINY